MEEQRGVSKGSLDLSASMFPLLVAQGPQVTPRGTLTGTVLTIAVLLLGYVGVSFARLLF